MAKKPTAPAPAADQPYYLQRAHIKDFRSIRDAVVEFKPGLNIIIGPNGSGKTNFVRCIQNTLGIPQISPLGEINILLNGREKIEVEFTKNNNSENNIMHTYGLAIKDMQQIIRLTYRQKKFEANNFLSAQFLLLKETARITDGISPIRLVVATHGIPFNYPLVSSTEEFVIEPRSVSDKSYDETYKESLFAQLLSTTISQQLLYIPRLLKEDGDIPTHEEIRIVLKQIEDFYIERLISNIKTFTPIDEIRLSPQQSIYTDSSRKQIIIKGIVLEFKINNDWLPFNSLSSGTQRLFYIISETISSFYIPHNTLRSFTNNDDIIIIEEPELGIHPHQLHLLLNFLREQSEKHQLIITTHSPQVLDMLREDELDRITICELHKTKGTQFRKLKKTQLADAKRYMREVGFLSDYWRMGDLEAAK